MPAQHALPTEIRSTVRTFAHRVKETLGSNLVGIYLLGSAVTTDFAPASSDIDFLVVTTWTVTKQQAEELAAVHRKLMRESAWGNRFEGSYAARGRLQPWGIRGQLMSVEGNRVRFNARSDWTAENIMALRDAAMALDGPKPSFIFPRVPARTLAHALRVYLVDLKNRRPRQVGETSAVLLDIARCLYGLEMKRPSLKSEAAAWLAQKAPDLQPILSAALSVRNRHASVAERRLLQAGVSRIKRYASAYLRKTSQRRQGQLTPRNVPRNRQFSRRGGVVTL